MKKYILILFIYIITVILCLAVKLQGIKIKQLEYEINNVSIQVQESEEHCKHMIDTNTDIIVNRRWENGE